MMGKGGTGHEIKDTDPFKPRDIFFISTLKQFSHFRHVELLVLKREHRVA